MGEFSQLLRDIVEASKVVSREINRAGLSGVEGMKEEENVQGEKQGMLDAIADARFASALIKGKQVCAILSKQSDGIIDTGHKEAKYVAVIDPLDGSSNIDINISVGSIFSVYNRKTKRGGDFSVEDFLQPGSAQVAAGYILYGASTMLVYTTGQGVNGFTYEPTLEEYFLSHPLIEQPATGEYYSINESQADSFPEQVKRYLSFCKQRNRDTRYVGSLVCDFHRNLLKGGVFLYPPNRNYSDGKLRLLYECNALAMIAEQAKGQATDGKRRILEILPEWHHQRVPFYTGSHDMVKELMGL
ncbi:class 1 fructose-bisphosphatase [Echinicola sediminis]